MTRQEHAFASTVLAISMVAAFALGCVFTRIMMLLGV
jgi:hypothetical protein